MLQNPDEGHLCQTWGDRSLFQGETSKLIFAEPGDISQVMERVTWGSVPSRDNRILKMTRRKQQDPFWKGKSLCVADRVKELVEEQEMGLGFRR